MRSDRQIESGLSGDAKLKTFGCGATIATSTMATEIIKGKSVEEAAKVTNPAVGACPWRADRRGDAPLGAG